MPSIVIRGGRPWGRAEAADILVQDGLVAAVEPHIDGGDEVVDATGRLVLPGLVEAHTHLDKTLFGGSWVPHSAGDDLADRIANDRRRRGELGIPDVDRVVALLERMVVSGTTHVRSHTDVDPEVGLRGVEVVHAAAQRLAGRVTVEQVAFPQHGVLATPGTAELLEEALRRGVGCVRSTFRRDEDIELALEAATYGGAATLGLASYGLQPGDFADLVVVGARTPAEAVVIHPTPEVVLKHGAVVARKGELV